ncbi:MAG: hypothetical protein HY518_03980 [Candidatus Aenigmarchaeota archaeon]|nr:hypothetical protein [Candidatus Aenigmarchaeota archaeon]
MAERNEAFFSLYENMFFVLKEELGEDRALDLFRNIVERGLKKSYDAAEPPFTKGYPQDFARVVGERDRKLGLDVRFPLVEDRKIVYQFHSDPFPRLKMHVSPENIDATYMRFKVSYLLGDGWGYRTTRHMWKGDGYTEHVITMR